MAFFRDLEMHWANEGREDKAHFELARTSLLVKQRPCRDSKIRYEVMRTH